MESGEARLCQCHCVARLSRGMIRMRPPSFKSWLKLTLKRSLGGSTKRKLKMHFDRLARSISKLLGKRDSPSVKDISPTRVSLAAGDLVRVRHNEEIRATLNAWNELEGCMFMDAQQQFCGTTQRVLQPVERFVDERDYRVKKAKGVVLLEGLICEGTPDYGRCDRACFYFWREEWLEKIEGKDSNV